MTTTGLLYMKHTMYIAEGAQQTTRLPFGQDLERRTLDKEQTEKNMCRKTTAKILTTVQISSIWKRVGEKRKAVGRQMYRFFLAFPPREDLSAVGKGRRVKSASGDLLHNLELQRLQDSREILMAVRVRMPHDPILFVPPRVNLHSQLNVCDGFHAK